ncbi:MAG: disulfide bond formation protein B [Alphaproteobacteria bacterium]|nr:MAG: disulfide bond formation protein B [Alphaproteobacteria bacterium]
MLAPSRDLSATQPSWRKNPAATAALVIALAGAAVIAGAWFFELVLKLRPCPLCLEQRVPYYIGIPLALVVALAAWRKAPRAAVVGGLIALAALMLWGAYLGAFHAGVEWKLWPGPAECSGAAELGPAGGLLDRLKTIVVVRCDEAAWRFLGLSLAGYNALISVALAAIALWGARAAKDYGSSSVSQ